MSRYLVLLLFPHLKGLMKRLYKAIYRLVQRLWSLITNYSKLLIKRLELVLEHFVWRCAAFLNGVDSCSKNEDLTENCSCVLDSVNFYLSISWQCQSWTRFNSILRSWFEILKFLGLKFCSARKYFWKKNKDPYLIKY